MNLRLLIAIETIIFFSASIKNASAQSGTLDNSFGGDGIFLYSNPGFSTTQATGIELQTDGKYVVSGKVSNQVPDVSKFIAMRVNSDGTADSSFGIDGCAANNTFGRSFAHDIGLQQDGKILLTGQDFNNVAITENIGVIRLNTDGSLDTSFGDSGRVDIDHGHTEEGHTIIQLADGKIVLTGHTDYDNASGAIDGPTKNNIFIARLNTDGSNDATFGVNGFATFDFDHTQDYSKNMILQGDKYIASGDTFANSLGKGALIRVNHNGVLDSTFGKNGLASVKFGVESMFWRMATQPDGKIIAAGQIVYTKPDYDLFVQRYFPDGKIDSSFGIDGTFSLDLGQPAEKFEDVAIQADGKIVCAGYSSTSSDNQSVGDAVVIQLKQDGTIDSTFASNGIFELSIVPGFDETKACLIDEQGRIVVAGYAHNTGNSGGSIFIFRLNSGCAASYAVIPSGSTTICKGQSVTLTVSPSASTYQWKKNGTSINGATSISYNAKAAGNYSCNVSGPCGTFTTNTIAVIVNPNPKAIIKPTGTVQICQGDSVQLKSNNTPGLSYQWFKAVSPITGATNSFYWAKEGGKYRVQTTDANGCSSQSSKTTIEIDCKTTAAEIDEPLVYPNPASSKIYVRNMTGLADEATIRIFDLTGRLALMKKAALSKGEIEIDVTRLQPGLYFLESESGGIIYRYSFAVSR